MNGNQLRRLHEALLNAFPDAGSLRRLVRFGLDQNLDAIADTSRLNNAIFELLQWAESRGKIATLIVAARNDNPDNSILRRVAEELQLAPNSSELESIVIRSVGFTNVEAWRARMSRCELTVCRVETPAGFGTGFLIGSDVVMTNHHVVSDAIAGAYTPQEIVLRFDYKSDEGGTTVQPGEEHRLAADWLIGSSPDNELDYALLRVNGKPGEAPVAGQPGAPARGWLTPQNHVFTKGEPLFIIQHPEARPLMVSAGGFLISKSSPQRIIHSVTTLGGSSGSPCFTSDWTLVALHNSGSASGNEAMPFSAIIQKLRTENISGLFI